MVAVIEHRRVVRSEAGPVSAAETARREGLDVHGPLVCAFPGLRAYVQCHPIDSPAANRRAREMRADVLADWLKKDGNEIASLKSDKVISG